MTLRRTTRSSRYGAGLSEGFSLVEVMVALVIIAVGLLGIAKMQALSLASTTSASMRSLAALEAASLAATMHADRNYWDSSPPATINVSVSSASGTTITSSIGGFPAAGANCTSTGTVPCTTTQVASYDLEQWAAALNTLLPNDGATITCTTGQAPPLNCTIQITWSENAVAVNSTEANASLTTEAFQIPTYTLYVEP